MADRLLIGVTGPSHGFKWAWYAIRWQLRRYGVTARYLSAQSGYPSEKFDGFIVSGGSDIDPALYAGDVSDSPAVDPLRDEYELQVLAEADRRGLPVMGICRGMQLMNVHAGGTLYGDLRSRRRLTSNRATLLPRKPVRVKPGSLVHQWAERDQLKVNSLHHQAVKSLGDGLVEAAHDRDSITQSIESVEGPRRLGVQWHPEYLPQRPEQRKLFQQFIEACRKRRSQTPSLRLLRPANLSKSDEPAQCESQQRDFIAT